MSEVRKRCHEHTGDIWFEVIIDPDKWEWDETTWRECKYCCDKYKFVGKIDDRLEPEYRELLISEICPKCWDKMFGKLLSGSESLGPRRTER